MKLIHPLSPRSPQDVARTGKVLLCVPVITPLLNKTQLVTLPGLTAIADGWENVVEFVERRAVIIVCL